MRLTWAGLGKRTRWLPVSVEKLEAMYMCGTVELNLTRRKKAVLPRNEIYAMNISHDVACVRYVTLSPESTFVGDRRDRLDTTVR